MNYSEKNQSIFSLTESNNNSDKVAITRIKNIGYNPNSGRIFIRVYRNIDKKLEGCFPVGTSVLSAYNTKNLVDRLIGKIEFSCLEEKKAFEQDLTTLVKALKNELPTTSKKSV